MPAPKIEPRTRDKIIRQTEDWVETFTCTTVEPSVEALTGRILAQDVQGIAAGTFITADLAQQISQIELSGVKVHGWLRPDAPIEVEPTVKTLTGCILNEDIRGEGQEIPKGTVISPELAEQISRIKGQVPVKVKLSPDAGSALIRIFGRFVELVIDRLNQVPEKNFLAFLNLIGADILPPQSARVPLTFALAEGSPVDALVPAGTQVAAPAAEGEEEDVIFESLW
jgi:hypothetical protein